MSSPDAEGAIQKLKMNYKLRPATNQDRADVESLVFKVLAEYGLSPDPDGIDADLRDIQGNYQASGGAFDLLVDDSGQLIGTVGLYPVSPAICELRKMYLVRSARGCGLGRRLLEHALSQASAFGFNRVVLETASVLREAIALYVKCGFRSYNPGHLAARCDAAYYLDLR